jgi:hypothetical protein
MKTVSFNNRDYVIELNWRRLSSDKPSKEIRQLASERGVTHGLVRETTDTDGTRVQLGLAEGGIAPIEPSAAAVLSEIEKSILVIEPIGDDLYWICGISDGEVIVGSDITASSGEIFRHAEDIIEMLEEAFEPYKLICPSSIIGSLPKSDVCLPQELTFAELIASSSINDDVYHRAIVKPLKSKKPIYIVGAAFIIFVSIFSYNSMFGKNEITAEELDWGPPAISQAEIRSQLEDKRAQEIREAREKALADEELWMTEYLGDSDPVKTIMSFKISVESSSQKVGGWVNTLITWNDSKADRLTRSWTGSEKKSRLVTPSTLLESIGEIKNHAFELNGANATTEHAFNRYPRTLTDKAMQVVGRKGSRTVNVMNSFIQLGFEWKLEATDMPKRKEPIAIEQDSDRRWEWINPVSKYLFTIEGSGMDNIDHVALVLNSHENMTLKFIGYDLPAQKWQIIGEFYESK